MNDMRVSEPEVPAATPPSRPADPLRRWTLAILVLCVLLFGWTLIADRLTPYTSDASVRTFVVRTVPEVSGKVIEVGVRDNHIVRTGDLLYRIDPTPFRIAVECADNPQIRKVLAALEQARLDLARTTLLAPGDGVVSNLQLNTVQFAAVGQPALTFLDTRLVWLQAFLRENSLEYIASGTRAEVVLDVLPGRVLPARVESIGWGVGEGDVDSTTGLPKTRQGTGGWLAPAQRFPVQPAFETAGGPPHGVCYNARASVILYTGEHPVANALAWLWIRLISVLTFVS